MTCPCGSPAAVLLAPDSIRDAQPRCGKCALMRQALEGLLGWVTGDQLERDPELRRRWQAGITALVEYEAKGDAA